MSGETKHSPEPWREHEDGGAIDVTGTGVIAPQFLFESLNPGDVRRIVACVNACAGIPTAMLEQFVSEFLHGGATPWKVRDAWQTLDGHRKATP